MKMVGGDATDVAANKGALKAHLPGDALIQCCMAKPPGNTMFSKVANVANIGYDDMLAYEELIIALVELSPECSMVVHGRTFLLIDLQFFVTFFLQGHLSHSTNEVPFPSLTFNLPSRS